ncbi:Arc family DNA-binding protein [Actinomycetospora sp. TBRC 11914]|uniref:Arc family DNA-binding protein n=1 Tax=Actinomycetospora sp. TBRC 11914 TaxID=2729387 RepID=UPI00145D6350|nr:Arc family DNA-binding protein [Actinomycetospora sp. TBRC 11914]NMO89802.1 Arc family DNA-binding protein [Actinomycetospora sp. TBRC 11914]
MAQVSWRAPDELVAQVKAVAEREGRSLNEYLTRVLTAVVDPDTADDEMAGLRERLARAGVLAPPTPAVVGPDPIAVAEARREVAGSGVSMSDLVSEGRG